MNHEEWGHLQFLDDLAETLERLNFLTWYRDATPEDMEIARRHNAERLDELIGKYKTEIGVMSISKRDEIWPFVG